MELAVLVGLPAAAALFLSSVAGYGGSLILVPALIVILGPHEGIALAALLLAWNNLFKIAAYRHTIPIRTGLPLIAVTAVGAFTGGLLLVAAPGEAIYLAVAVVTFASLAAEVVGSERLLRARRAASMPLMAVSSVLSGFSGTSGPLKGVAIRALGLPRMHHVGLAAAVSLVGDVVKVEVFAASGLLSDIPWPVVLALLPVMPIAAWAGRSVNQRISERAFQWVFWMVVAGYVFRMLGLWA